MGLVVPYVHACSTSCFMTFRHAAADIAPAVVLEFYPHSTAHCSPTALLADIAPAGLIEIKQVRQGHWLALLRVDRLQALAAPEPPPGSGGWKPGARAKRWEPAMCTESPGAASWHAVLGWRHSSLRCQGHA